MVYRGYAIRDRMPVIIKALKEEAANPIGISRLIHEHEITRNLNIEAVIKPVRLEQSGSLFALVMEDTGAVSLRKYMQDHQIELSFFLDIAVRLAEALAQLHQKGIIHRDLKPENILVHPDTGKGYIIDFSSAALFTTGSENTHFYNNLAGTLEYMAPEQTGRLSIGVDQRTDLYSLGVVFYEMMTGQLPLQEDAILLYGRAIKSARKNGYIQCKALANKLAARFYLPEGRSKIARMYMMDACSGYNRWGAFPKVKELQDRYPDLLDGIAPEETKSNFTGMLENALRNSTSSNSETASSMVMYIIDKAVVNISKETNLSRLLDSFLNIAIQSAGANKGYEYSKKHG